jgi:hypothetical protein
MNNYADVITLRWHRVGTGSCKGISVGDAGGIFVGDAEGVADSDAVVVFAVVTAFDALLVSWLLLFDDKQPTTNKEVTTSNRTIITVIGFNCIRLCKRQAVT